MYFYIETETINSKKQLFMRVLSKFIWVAFMLPIIMWSCSPIDEPAIIPQTASTLTSPTAGTAIVLLQDEKEDTIFFRLPSLILALREIILIV